MQSVTILGSTGSIGISSLRAIREMSRRFRVKGLVCRRNIPVLREQILEFQPECVAVESDETCGTDEYKALVTEFPGVEFLCGSDGVLEISRRKVDVLISAIVGGAGLAPTLEAIGNAGRIALANKETLVMAGKLFMSKIKASPTELLPVDSEHSAIFSLTKLMKYEDINRIILTASGGSLRDFPACDLSIVTPEIALQHPTWDMGNKITIDSATLMNKGLEVIEAHHLFDVDYDNIDVIIHPQSVVHSMVETVDGSMYSHMGIADMALPILNALMYPGKVENSFGRLDLSKVGSLQFYPYDKNKYPALELCYSAGKAGGTMPAVLNAANEVAVHAFLKEKILFTDIVKIVEKAMKGHMPVKDPEINDIFQADGEGREIAESLL